MRNKKKRVIASILSISILFQAMMSPMTADASLHGGDAINAANTSFFSRIGHWLFGGPQLTIEQQLLQAANTNAELIQSIMQSRNMSFSDAYTTYLYTVNNMPPVQGGFLRRAGGWLLSGIGRVISGTFASVISLAPILLSGLVYTWISQYWNNYQTKKELGNTTVAHTPIEARLKFLRLAAGHKGQDIAIGLLLNIIIFLSYCVLQGTSIRKLIFEVGPPGTGKTTLIEIMALALGCGFFNVSASDVDPGSNKSVIDQIFGPRIKRMNNSEYFEDSPVMKFLRATEGQPLRIVAINEFDKLSEKDKKLLLEFLRNAYDNGYAYINGERINLENVVWVLTSNEEDATLFGSPSLMSRFEIIRFARLNLHNYIEILQIPFTILANDFENGHNVHINFGNTILDIAQRLDAGDTGARGVQAYVNTLTSRILNYIYSSENVNRVANKEPIYINVSYDGENDNFIIEETEAPANSEEENLNLLSENEDDEDSELSENTDDEGDSKLSEGSEDEETHADDEKLSLLSENEGAEEDSKLSEGSEDEEAREENTEQESPADMNEEAEAVAVSQKRSDDFESAKKDLSKKEKD